MRLPSRSRAMPLAASVTGPCGQLRQVPCRVQICHPCFPIRIPKAWKMVFKYNRSNQRREAAYVHEMRMARMAMVIVKIRGGGLSFSHSLSAVWLNSCFPSWYLEPVSSVDSISEDSRSGNSPRPDLADEGAWLDLRRLLAADISCCCCACCSVSCRKPPSTFSVRGCWQEGGCCIVGDRTCWDTSESPILHILRPQNLQAGFWTSLSAVFKSFSCM